MSITLSDGTTTVTLNADLKWTDEFNWQPVEQRVEYSLTGAAIITSSAKQAGRPITLEPDDDTSAWMVRAIIEQLRNWAVVAGQTLELTLRGVTRNVAFRHQDGPGLEARPLIHFSDGDIDAADYYLATLRLMEI